MHGDAVVVAMNVLDSQSLAASCAQRLLQVGDSLETDYTSHGGREDQVVAVRFLATLVPQRRVLPDGLPQLSGFQGRQDFTRHYMFTCR